MPYQLVPVLDQADETLQLSCTILQEVALDLHEAGGELALFPQGGALPDETFVDFRARRAADADMTQDIIGRQHIKLHLLVKMRRAQLEAECPGVGPP